MKKFNNLSMIFGLIFSIGLGVVAYLCLVLGIALAFAGNEWFGNMAFVFFFQAIITLISSFFARKKIMVTIIVDIISLIAVLFVLIYLLTQVSVIDGFGMIALFLGVLVFGVLSLLFGILAKKKQTKNEVIEVSEQV
ncbi:MAG: hypothetical protein IJ310_01585 [Clostridia bacterium]|nr:hypothetical protein [Clostridia bacterium]